MQRAYDLAEWAIRDTEMTLESDTAMAPESELIKALDPFVRAANMLEPLHLSQSTPLVDVLPGIWPTVGDLRRLRDIAAKASNTE